ncbi:Defect at low temperature protein 1 [Seiridium cupressi]
MSHPRSTARRIYHYIYNSVYVLLCIILAALILVTPGDAIRQTYFDTLQYTNIVIIAIAYLVTVLIVLFIYTLRLYVTRTVLASIPKSWVPTGKGEVKKDVREMINRELGRSAAIAWQARPKVGSATTIRQSNDMSAVTEENTDDIAQQGSLDEEKVTRTSSNWLRHRKTGSVESEMGIDLPPTKPVWGKIEHPGWGSPESPDLANIQYITVLAELPNLIEAKAMSLAPRLSDSLDESPFLDPEAVAALQRSGNMGMRIYVGRLVDLGVLESSRDIAEFLDVYERARFSTKPIPVAHFRRLMHLFAELLRSAKPLDRDVLETMRHMDEMYSDSEGASLMDNRSVRHARSHHNADIDDDAPQDTGPSTPARSLRTLDSDASPKATGSLSSRLRVRRPGMVGRNSSGNTRTQYGTAPTTPKSRAGHSTNISSRNQRLRSNSRGDSTRSSSSANSFAQTRRPFMGGSLGSSSQGSLRSASQGSEGSVIRLARHDDGGDLPYVLRVSDTF